MNLNPFIDLFRQILSIYNFLLVTWIALSWLVYFQIVNPYQPLVRRVNEFLGKMINPVVKYLSRYVPRIGGVDLSVIVLFLLLRFLDNILVTYFYWR